MEQCVTTQATQPADDAREIPLLSIPDIDRDPHGMYRHYRAETPFLRRSDGGYLALRAHDIEQLIRDSRTRQVETEFLALRGITEGPLFDVVQNSMLYSNDDKHRSRRAPMSRAFAFRMMASLRPGIRAVADELIEARLKDGSMNLIDDYASLIPARTIASILGLAEHDIPRFTSWVYTFSRAISASFTPADLPAINDAARELNGYVARLVDDRRSHPRDDFLTSFVASVDAENELSPAEILAQLVTIIVAGSDTTRGAMAIQTSLLLTHREQWDAVCADASLIPGAVAEALRYEPIAASVPRFTIAEIEIEGYVVPAGRLLTLSTMSAMRDPALYKEPDRFDIRRMDHPRWHPVFGGGAHRCLGEALAKAELEEGLAALAARLPKLRVEGEALSLNGHAGIRRVSPMHVTWG